MRFQVRSTGLPPVIFTLDTSDLTDEQYARFNHHIKISAQVFEASVRSMLKGVRKYGPEPPQIHRRDIAEYNAAHAYWLPHIFSEGVDAANQTGLLADTLGVEVLP